MVENVVGIDACHFHVDAVIILAFYFLCFFAKAFHFTQAEIVSCPAVNKVATEHGTIQAQFKLRLLRLLAFT